MLTRWPTAVLVDLDNTLHDYREAARALRSALALLIEQNYGVQSDIVLARYEQLIAGEHDATFASGRDLRVARMRLLCETWPETRLAKSEQWADFIETGLLERLQPHAGALEAFRRLQGMGRTMILTEGYADVQGAIAEKLGLSCDPNVFIATKAHNVRKADGSAFQRAAELLDVAADEIVMVGDNWKWDIIGAAKTGIWQVWVGSDERDTGGAPDGYLGRVSSFSEVPEFLAAKWSTRRRNTYSPFLRAYDEERQRCSVDADRCALVTSLQRDIEAITADVVIETGFGERYRVERIMNVGSTSRGTYASFPADFDIVVHSAHERTSMEMSDVEKVCARLVERVAQTESYGKYWRAIPCPGGKPDIGFPTIMPESLSVRGPQSLVARYDLVWPSSAGRYGFLDVTFGKLPQIIGYEIAVRRIFEILGPIRAEWLRAEIRFAKVVLRSLGEVYGSANRGLRAHAIEQWIIQSSGYRSSGCAVGTLDNALRLIVEEGVVARADGSVATRPFAIFKERFPLWHHGWWESEMGFEPGARNVNLWDLLGDGDVSEAEHKWKRLIALGLALARMHSDREAWKIENLVEAAEAAFKRIEVGRINN